MTSPFPSTYSARLRACKACSYLSTSRTFNTKGCLNCGKLSKNLDYTSLKHKGFIGLVQPNKSWVAKWQRIQDCTQGLYAMTVEGDLDEDSIFEYEKAGRSYINRSTSFQLD